jgi:hypothetical protein
MIPDNTFIFNQRVVPRNFDDHETRLRYRLGQDALLTLEGGRHLLYVCPACKYPWYKAGRREYPRLTSAQLACLGSALHANIQALHQLPRALCPLCSTVYLGGMFSIEEYPHRKGYCFLWESASPQHIRMLAMVCQHREGFSLDALVQTVPETFTTSIRDVRAVLAWLETCPFPETVQAYTEEHSQQLARRCPPGSASYGRERLWRGYAWDVTCPALGGEVLVSLAVALRPETPWPLLSLRIGWHILARAMRTVL